MAPVKLADAHEAILDAYRRRDVAAPTVPLPGSRGSRVAKGLAARKPLDPIWQTLAHAPPSVPHNILRLAVWNLLSSHKEEQSPKNAAFVKRLFREPAKLVQQRSQLTRALLPPFPATISGEPRWSVSDTPDGLSARIELAVMRPIEDLKVALDPRLWLSESPLFWRKKAASREAIDANAGLSVLLALPGAGTQSATLDFQSTEGPFEARVDYRISNLTGTTREGAVASCNGFLQLMKLEGQPGYTRVVLQRTARFNPTPRLDALAYWVQADAVCLVVPDEQRPLAS
jgi:hypothetical protein